MKNIKHLIEKSRQTPALAAIYAVEVDRQLRGLGQSAITFSATDLAEGAVDIGISLGINKLFDSLPSQQTGGAIYQAEKLAKDGQIGEAIAHAFSKASGAEVNFLNLLYANHSTTNPKLRQYFLNKYFASYGLEINLQANEGKDFFHHIKSTQTHEKVDGPLVTVIMPAYNAESTIEQAVGSLLNQSWQNLQLIVVNDASTDGTLQKAKDLAKCDPRVEVLSNTVNVGPYVCRNLGVLHTRGQWLTVQNADDWAFPDRIEQQMVTLTTTNALACTGRMLRINQQGQITRPVTEDSIAEDGYLRFCHTSVMVQTAFFRKELGAWDSVRVGGDAELIERLKVMSVPQQQLYRPLMVCLDHEADLAQPISGLSEVFGLPQSLQAEYKQAFSIWHQTPGPKKMSPFEKAQSFATTKINQIDQGAIKKVFTTREKSLALLKASDMFNAEWYSSQYPEFKQTGLEAAEHYLVYGNTGATDPSPNFSSRFYLLSRSIKTNPLVHHLIGKDTGPNHKRVLLAAAEVSKSGMHERGIALAEEHLPSALTYTANILKANAALAKGDEAGWQKHLNAYLSHFDVEPICLDTGEGTVFDRLNTAPFPPVSDGPLISVIMPAWNAEKTVRKAAQSILNQTWLNLELLIVDDASTDSTWAILQEIAALDKRVKIYKNSVNVGPYVSKNIALLKSKGEWITGHDADDWAHPKRLEDHILEAEARKLEGSITYMVRVNPDGFFTFIGMVSSFSLGGTARKASISCLFKRSVLVQNLGFWDSVRFGADSEMIYRAEKVLGDKFGLIRKIGMICLDIETSLTNHSVYGIDKLNGISPIRANYRDAWTEWLEKANGAESCYLPFPQQHRRYAASSEMIPSLSDIEKNLKEFNND